MLLALTACTEQPYNTPENLGKDVFMPDGLAMTVPAVYHESVGNTGRTFRIRGGAQASYNTIHVQNSDVGVTVPVDEAFSMVLARLRAQDKFDLLDVQLSFIGPYLALSYAADFSWLDVPRRQWGVLVERPHGIVAILMTAPIDRFLQAASDFQSVFDSLQQL